MKPPAANLIDYLEYRKILGEKSVEIEPETLEALSAFAAGASSAAAGPTPDIAPAAAPVPANAGQPAAQAIAGSGTGAAPVPVAQAPDARPPAQPTVDFVFVGEQEGVQGNRAKYSETLRKMVLSMGYGKGQALFTNICIGRREATPPSQGEMAAAMPAFRAFIAKARPRGLVVLGPTALLGLLGKNDVSAVHGHVFAFDGIPAIPTYHPAYMEMFPSVKRDACRDLCNALKAIGRQVTPALAPFQ